jgi:TDG/mug DNA glycosylase family protein
MNIIRQAAELSPSEMTDSVPSFLAKVVRYRPRIVCFVGMGIWRTVEKVIANASLNEGGGRVRLSSPSKGKPKKSGVASVGLQPYKLVYDTEHPEQIGM